MAPVSRAHQRAGDAARRELKRVACESSALPIQMVGPGRSRSLPRVTFPNVDTEPILVAVL